MEQKRTAVLVHGQFLAVGVWESVMWGDPKNGRFGVLPAGLKVAIENMATLIYFGNGIPKETRDREFSPDVSHFLLARKGDLGGLAWGRKCLNFCERVFDDSVQNTNDEIQNMAKLCQEHEIERLFLITAPQHIMRAHREALSHKERGGFGGVEIFSHASEIGLPGGTVSQVGVLESGHRPFGDGKAHRLDLYAGAMVRLMKNDPKQFQKFQEELKELLATHGSAVDLPN